MPIYIISYECCSFRLNKSLCTCVQIYVYVTGSYFKFSDMFFLLFAGWNLGGKEPQLMGQ
jgi:hypothetical protein